MGNFPDYEAAGEERKRQHKRGTIDTKAIVDAALGDVTVPVEAVEAVFDGSPQPFGSNWPEPGRYLLVRLKNDDRP